MVSVSMPTKTKASWGRPRPDATSQQASPLRHRAYAISLTRSACAHQIKILMKTGDGLSNFTWNAIFHTVSISDLTCGVASTQHITHYARFRAMRMFDAQVCWWMLACHSSLENTLITLSLAQPAAK